MTFVNEFASDEDIDKFRLNELWRRYRPSRDEDFRSGHGMITIDRDRNLLFMTIRQGREEKANRKTILLWINGQVAIANIDLVGGLNPDGFKSKPFRIRWELADLHPEEGFKVPRETIIRILKKALTTYGHRGADKQIPNTIVEFSF